MNVLLDTRALIWTLTDSSRLSARARAVLVNPDTVVHVSAVTLTEMAVKATAGTLTIEGTTLAELPAVLTSRGVHLIAMEPTEATALAALPVRADHPDPFGRMLTIQALTRGLTLLSPDRTIPPYRKDGLSLIW